VVRAQGTIGVSAAAFDAAWGVTRTAWGASTGEMAHHAPSLPARDALGTALHHRQPRQDLLSLEGKAADILQQ
jgi:hypothetical protein